MDEVCHGLFGLPRCKFEARYDNHNPPSANIWHSWTLEGMESKDLAGIMAAKKTYIHDVCVSCGKIVERSAAPRIMKPLSELIEARRYTWGYEYGGETMWEPYFSWLPVPIHTSRYMRDGWAIGKVDRIYVDGQWLYRRRP